MGAMGRFIDECSDEQRDRIIEAQDFGNGTEWVAGDCRCLVGYAYDISDDGITLRDGSWSATKTEVYLGFPRAIRRFGAPRIIAAVKNRAAKNNSIDSIVIEELIQVEV